MIWLVSRWVRGQAIRVSLMDVVNLGDAKKGTGEFSLSAMTASEIRSTWGRQLAWDIVGAACTSIIAKTRLDYTRYLFEDHHALCASNGPCSGSYFGRCLLQTNVLLSAMAPLSTSRLKNHVFSMARSTVMCLRTYLHGVNCVISVSSELRNEEKIRQLLLTLLQSDTVAREVFKGRFLKALSELLRIPYTSRRILVFAD
jgi:hypothetical protein